MKFTWSRLLPVLLLITAVVLETTASRDVKRRRGRKSRISDKRRQSVAKDEDAEASGRVVPSSFLNIFPPNECSTAAPVSSESFTYVSGPDTSTGTGKGIVTNITTNTYTGGTLSPKPAPSSPHPPARNTHYVSSSDYDDDGEYDDDYYDDDNYAYGDTNGGLTMFSNDQNLLRVRQSDTRYRDLPNNFNYVYYEDDSADIADNVVAVSDANENGQGRQRRIRRYRRGRPGRGRRRRNNPRRRLNIRQIRRPVGIQRRRPNRIRYFRRPTRRAPTNGIFTRIFNNNN